MPGTRRAGRAGRRPPVLLVLCGPSHAGKSTFARRWCQGFCVVSSEAIRRELTGSARMRRDEERVWRTFDARKRQALSRGDDVVLDACHLTEKARRHALEGPNARHRKVLVLFDVPLEVVRQRCLEAKRLPLAEVERMWQAFQVSRPSREEAARLGFDEVHVVGRAGQQRHRFRRRRRGSGTGGHGTKADRGLSARAYRRRCSRPRRAGMAKL